MDDLLAQMADSILLSEVFFWGSLPLKMLLCTLFSTAILDSPEGSPPTLEDTGTNITILFPTSTEEISAFLDKLYNVLVYKPLISSILHPWLQYTHPLLGVSLRNLPLQYSPQTIISYFILPFFSHISSQRQSSSLCSLSHDIICLLTFLVPLSGSCPLDIWTTLPLKVRVPLHLLLCPSKTSPFFMNACNSLHNTLYYFILTLYARGTS